MIERGETRSGRSAAANQMERKMDMALIYIVEDDKNIREIESFALKNAGYEIQGFVCAKDFYHAVSRQRPDLRPAPEIRVPNAGNLRPAAEIRAPSSGTPRTNGINSEKYEKNGCQILYGRLQLPAAPETADRGMAPPGRRSGRV